MNTYTARIANRCTNSMVRITAATASDAAQIAQDLGAEYLRRVESAKLPLKVTAIGRSERGEWMIHGTGRG